MAYLSTTDSLTMFQFGDDSSKFKTNDAFIANFTEKIKNEEDLFRTFDEEFEIPYGWGHNWDALSDIMAGINWIKEKK